MIDAGDLLETAAKTLKERAAERDTDKERAMLKTVTMVNAMYPELNMTESQGWAFMLFLKFARASQGNFRADDYVDAASYAALLGECEGKNAPTESSVKWMVGSTPTPDPIVTKLPAGAMSLDTFRRLTDGINAMKPGEARRTYFRNNSKGYRFTKEQEQFLADLGVPIDWGQTIG